MPLDHVSSQLIQGLVEKVVMSTQSSTDPTFLLDSVESTKVVTPLQSLVNPTLLLGSDVSTDYVFSISSSILS